MLLSIQNVYKLDVNKHLRFVDKLNNEIHEKWYLTNINETKVVFEFKYKIYNI